MDSRTPPTGPTRAAPADRHPTLTRTVCPRPGRRSGRFLVAPAGPGPSIAPTVLCPKEQEASTAPTCTSRPTRSCPDSTPAPQIARPRSRINLMLAPRADGANGSVPQPFQADPTCPARNDPVGSWTINPARRSLPSVDFSWSRTGRYHRPGTRTVAQDNRRTTVTATSATKSSRDSGGRPSTSVTR